MPATFAHCLMAQQSIDRIQRKMKRNDPLINYAKIIGEKNNFVVMGAAGPDYPYLTDILTTSVVPISHTWANRMHYENTNTFFREGVIRLRSMDKAGEPFAIRLAWLCGFASHVIADSYLHPVVNSITGGTYLFTHQEHGKCELIQDIYIFKKITEEDIISASPRGGKLGYLRILEECCDPDDKDMNRLHPQISTFWKELLEASHKNAKEYFGEITPDKWHYNYRAGVNFVADPGAIFRHVIGLTGRAYRREAEITLEEREKYIEKIKLPNGATSHYDEICSKTMGLIVDTWTKLFKDIGSEKPSDTVAEYIKDWNLDTGVDESRIDLWF